MSQNDIKFIATLKLVDNFTLFSYSTGRYFHLHIYNHITFMFDKEDISRYCHI